MKFTALPVGDSMIPSVSEFQAAATAQGKAMEAATETLLRMHGWDITGRHQRIDGQEIDITATDPHGNEWWIECKGSWEGNRQGGKRTDTLKKAVAVGWFLSTIPNRRPYLLVLSHRPNPGSTGDVMLQRAIDHGLFARVITLTEGW